MHKEGDSEQPAIGVEQLYLAATAVSKIEAAEKPAEGSMGKSRVLDDVEGKLKQFRVSSGKTHETEMPITCAALTFPALDKAVAQGGYDAASGLVNDLKAKLKSSNKFTNDYFYRRAQASYECIISSTLEFRVVSG
ncbi:MAG: hypothetical protein Q9170_007128 [Blastenia crenularia]